MCAITSIIIVQRYFTKRRAIAGSLSSVGLGFFAVIASPMTRGLVQLYGWRGAVLILGGLNIQVLVPGAMYRPAILPQKLKSGDSSLPDTDQQSISSDIQKKQCVHRVWDLVNYYFDKRLLTWKFVLHTIGQCTRLVLVDAYYIRLAPIGLSIGMTPVAASFLPSAVAICTAFNRGMSGLLAYLVSPTTVFGVFNLIAAVTVFCVPFLPHTLAAYATFAVLFGISMGMFVFLCIVLRT